ncbi:MAG TPA: hypothetical protein VK504_27290, partial [Vicinamibacterales bacterium]|nr:hypothetical protein [Vicinamibacterales bacterium]
MACKHCGAETWCEHATLPVADDQDALENAAAIAKAKAHTALDEYLERLWRRGAGEADTRDAAAALHAACDAVINAWLSSR